MNAIPTKEQIKLVPKVMLHDHGKIQHHHRCESKVCWDVYRVISMYEYLTASVNWYRVFFHRFVFCSHNGGGVEFCHDYVLVFFISVQVHLLLASGEKKSSFL